MIVRVNEMSLYDASGYYIDIGMRPHPLSRPNDKEASPGKRPLLKDWTNRGTLTEDEREKYFKKNQFNIGNICGKESNTTVIDRDLIVKGIWDYITKGINTENFVIQKRTDGRDHLFFQYSPELESKKYHPLGFEILNNGCNVVLCPSVHAAGQKYQFNRDPSQRPTISKSIIDRIKEIVSIWHSLEEKVNKCRPPFRNLFKALFINNSKSNPYYRDVSLFNGATGRQLTLHLFAELKRNGGTKEELILLCMLIFGNDYDEKESSYQIDKINHEATATTETIKADPVLSQFYNGDELTHSPLLLEEEEPTNEVPEYIKNKAEDTSQHADTVEFIVNTHQTIHVGDVNLAKTLLVSIGVQSVLNSEGLQPKVSGDSGKGKTHCCKALAHLVPRKWMHETSLSNRAIYYMEDELLPGSIVFCDDVNMSEELQGIVKRATSNFQRGDTYTTIDINRRKKTLKIPPRICWWFTSVDDDQSIQLLNRQFGGGVDEREEQDIAVSKHQLEIAASGETDYPETDDVLVCREIIREIKEQIFIVKIPFASRIEWYDKSNRRNLPIFLDIIRGFTVLRHLQREKDADGALIATVDDFYDAKALYTSRAENQGLKLTDAEKKLCRAIVEIGGEATIEQVARAIGVCGGRVRHLVYGKKRDEDSGLIHKVKGFYTESRNVESSTGTRVNKTYLILKNFSIIESFQHVVELTADTDVPGDTTSHTHSYTPIINKSRECSTSNTNIEGIETSTTPTTIEPQNSNTYCEQNKKVGMKGTRVAEDADNEGTSVGTSEGTNEYTLSTDADCKGITNCSEPKPDLDFQSSDSNKMNSFIHSTENSVKSVNLPLSQALIDSVFRWMQDWEAVYKTQINSTNRDDVAREYADKHNADFEQVLYVVKKYAGIPVGTSHTSQIAGSEHVTSNHTVDCRTV